MRLIDHLKHLGLSNSEAKKALQTGKVFLYGIPTADGGREIEPYQIELRPDAPRLTPGRDLVIVHKDDDLVVIWKPSGMLSVPASKEGGHLNALGLVSKLIRSPTLAVHRIDQGTSGLMMMARNEAAQQHLKDQLERHSVERRYVALIHGRPPDKTWTVSNQLADDRGDGMRGSVDGRHGHRAQHAKTNFTHLQRIGKQVNLVEARLHTGRTHQVRIHLAEAGTPILGDDRYGTAIANRGISRLCLHAVVLGIEHPTSGETMRFTSPLPDGMEKALRSFKFQSENPLPKRKKSRKPKKHRS
jgi:23S rRNA pseudouridine1911/1915/1917 synthase